MVLTLAGGPADGLLVHAASESTWFIVRRDAVASIWVVFQGSQPFVNGERGARYHGTEYVGGDVGS